MNVNRRWGVGLMGANQLQDMSMPELWQMAIRLGISKKGSKTELVERIEEAREERDIFEGLKRKMIAYEKTREELKALIESASRLAPRFHEEKEILEKSIREDQERIGKIDDLTARLEREREELHEDAERRLEQISEIEVRIRFLSQAANVVARSLDH